MSPAAISITAAPADVAWLKTLEGKAPALPSLLRPGELVMIHLDHIRLAPEVELGHTDQELLFRHYRELVTPDQAAKWWDIRPAQQTKLVAISA